MPKLKIYTYPDIVLAQKARPIARVEKTFHKLADDMLETMYDAPGIGLAANQVGVLERFVVIDTDYDLEEDTGVVKNRKPIILINPEIILKEGSIVFSEGCLSVPEYTAEVKRAEKIKVQYRDVDGLTQTLMAEGLLAVAIQHELDHLDGKLFIDRLSPLKKEIVRKQLKQERALREEEARMKGNFDPLKPPKKKTKGF
jgi:peptide deformylase